jgi:hypothetical protein
VNEQDQQLPPQARAALDDCFARIRLARATELAQSKRFAEAEAVLSPNGELAGLLAVSLSAMICLNIGHAAISFIATYPQLVKGTLAPRSFGSDLFASFFAKARISLFLGYGTLAAKYVAITMLPVPGGVMGQLLLQLAKKRHEDKLITIYSLFTTLVTLPILICWAIALVSYFWRNH